MFLGIVSLGAGARRTTAIGNPHVRLCVSLISGVMLGSQRCGYHRDKKEREEQGKRGVEWEWKDSPRWQHSKAPLELGQGPRLDREAIWQSSMDLLGTNTKNHCAGAWG